MNHWDGLTVLIPARGGSKTVPGKNLQPINRTPLVVHAANTALPLGNVVVTTDDPTIRQTCLLHGIPTINRPDHLADDTSTVDDVVAYHLDNHHVDYPLLVLQPTVPEISTQDLSKFIDATDAGNYRSAVMAVPADHLYWHADQPLQIRTNRQTVDPLWQEIGVRYYRQAPADPPKTVWHLNRPVIDIDTPDDLATVRRRLEKWDLVFDYTVGKEVGLGHLVRCFTLSQRMDRHLRGYGSAKDMLLLPPPTGKGVWVFDRLDTTVEQVAAVAAIGWRTVTLEDRGPGARIADATINALYPLGNLPHEHAGPDWVVLRPEFQGLPERSYSQGGTVLVTFGGTDPAGLTERVVNLFTDEPYCHGDGTLDVSDTRENFSLRVIRPPGEGQNRIAMAAELQQADLVITSAGRTLYEAAAVGTPAVSIAANARETTHAHTGIGNLYLGHHAQVSDSMIERTVRNLAASEQLRTEIGVQGKESIDGKGTDRIVHLIEGLML